MTTVPRPAPIDDSHISETLDRARILLQRRYDETLARKAFVVQGYVQLARMHPERDYREALNRALTDLKNLLSA
jgi:hypothetical protein